MKIRSCFVSNSSSTNFAVVIKGDEEKGIQWLRKYVKMNNGKLYFDTKDGCTAFGWEFKNYYYIFDKINFAKIQAEYIREWKKDSSAAEMLDKVLLESVPEAKSIKWSPDFNISNYDVYIDHQSSAIEDKNLHIFKSEEELKSFLFGPNSYIRGGNDNV